MFGSSIKAVLAVELPRLKPPPDAIGGCLARTRSLLLARQGINRLAAGLLSLLPSVLLISGPMYKKKGCPGSIARNVRICVLMAVKFRATML